MNTTTDTQDTKTNWKTTLKMLGPGLLFAGAAIGVSHLVQSTKAGAGYGLGLIGVVFLIHLVKYPFFEFGPRYASTKGESLLDGYKKLGNWVMIVFIIMTLGTMFAVQSAVTIVTAGLAMNIFGVFDNINIWVAIVLAVCLAILLIGRYSFLDNLMKIVIITLTICTVFAVTLALGKPAAGGTLSIAQEFPVHNFIFLIALMGWLPAPVDLSVWHSLWAIEKQKDTVEDFNLKRSLLDFNIGYIGTVILAIAFLLLGALVMYGSGEEFSTKGGVFAGQLIELYTTSLGEWARVFISVAALTTMFSTTLTVLDAIPRVMSKTTEIISEMYNNTAPTPTILDDGQAIRKPKDNSRQYYWIWMGILVAGTLVLLNFFISSMGEMVQIATVLSFLTAPFFAIANYRLVTRSDFPEAARPSKPLIFLSWFGIIFLVGFGVIYLLSLLGIL